MDGGNVVAPTSCRVIGLSIRSFHHLLRPRVAIHDTAAKVTLPRKRYMMHITLKRMLFPLLYTIVTVAYGIIPRYFCHRRISSEELITAA